MINPLISALIALTLSVGGWFGMHQLQPELNVGASTFVVQQGGTGANTFSAGRLLYGSGTSPIQTVATGTISSANSALTVTADRSAVGGAAVFTIATTSNNMFTGTAGQVLAFLNGGWVGVATTTLSTITGILSADKGGTGVTTFGGVNRVLYTTAADTLASESAFTYDESTDTLSVPQLWRAGAGENLSILADSALTLDTEDAGGTLVLRSANTLGLSTHGGSPLAYLSTQSMTADRVFTFPDTAGTLCVVGVTCDGSGGSSAFEIATTSDIAVPQLAYFTKTSGRTTLGSVATTTLSGGTTGLSFSNSPAVIGSSASALLGTLVTGNGGTGTTTWMNGGVTFYDSILGTLSQGVTQAALFFDKTNSRLGIGTTTPQKLLHVYGSISGGIARFERRTAGVASSLFGTQNLSFSNTGTDTDKTGPTQTFEYIDSAGTINTIGEWGAWRDSANSSGSLIGYSYDAGARSQVFTMTGPNGIFAIGSSSPSAAADSCGAYGLCVVNAALGPSGAGNLSEAQIKVISATSTDEVRGWWNARSNTGDTATFRSEFGTETNHPVTFWSNNTLRAALFKDGGFGFGLVYGGASIANVALDSGKVIIEKALGIGTTSPYFQLQIASSTGSQIALSDTSATSLRWNIRATPSSLFFATSSPSTFATTSTAALEIAASGFGTTTLRGLNIIGQATSTSNVGFNLTTGCFAINGTCVGGSGGGGSPGGTGTELQYRAGASTFGAVSSAYDSSGSGRLGIGTTTMQLPVLTLASTTGPQLGLSYGAGVMQWIVRNNNGRFSIASTTVDGNTEAATPQISINGTTGNVGIRSTSPIGALEVRPASNGPDVLNIARVDGTRSFSLGTYPGDPAFVGFWAGTASPGTTNYALLSDGSTETVFNVPNASSAMYFRLNNSTGLTLRGAGLNVGVGTTSPYTRFGVVGPNTIEIPGSIFTNSGTGLLWTHSNTNYIGSLGNFSGGGSPFIGMHSKHSATANTIQNSGAGVKGMFWTWDGTNLDTVINGTATANANFSSSITPFRITSTGTIFFNNLTSATNDNAVCIDASTKEIEDAGNTTCVTSSERFKKNIEKMMASDALNTVLALTPSTFKYIPSHQDLKRDWNGEIIGLIAEQVEKVDPRLVQYETIDGKRVPRSLHFESLTALTIGAIQSLAVSDAKQNDRLEALEARLGEVEKELAVYKNMCPLR